MSRTMTRVEDIPKLGHTEAMRLAETEYRRFADLIGSLDESDWSKPTDCDRWKVQHVVSHLIGMAEAMTTFRTMFAQQKASKPYTTELPNKLDAWTEYQAHLHKDALALPALFNDRYPAALKRREKLAAPLRQVRFPAPPYGFFSFAYLMDDILTRDVWMHRVDISRATGRDPVLTPEHDGRFVANIVRDLAKRWKRSFTLQLEGPAGGVFVNGSGGPDIRVDAVEFCRILSGRSEGHGLPTDVVPF